jgi:hypothetical protein
MKLVMKTSEKFVLEVTSEEIENKGFDSIWDKVREIYPAKKFEVYSISADTKSDEVIFIELIPLR